MQDSTIIFRTDPPEYSYLLGIIYDWEETIYGNNNEAIQHGDPTLLKQR